MQTKILKEGAVKFINRIYHKFYYNNPVKIDDAKRKIMEYLPSDPVILEAGAFDGTDSLQMANLWPKGVIHSFEPVAAVFNKAKANLQHIPNVQLYPFALSDTTGKTEINLSSGHSEASSSILSPKKHLEVHPGVKFESKVMVDTFTIDDWAQKYQVDKIDFAWLDLQGAEFKVLNGSPRIFSTINVLFTEVSLIETYSGVMLYPAFREWLESHKFQVVLEDLPYKDMGNVLFVRQNL